MIFGIAAAGERRAAARHRRQFDERTPIHIPLPLGEGGAKRRVRVSGLPLNILIMTSQAVVRRPLLLVAIQAKAHRVIDGALGDGHLRQIAMTGRALDFRADMRRMIEPDMRFPDESVNPLPGKIFSTFGLVAQGLNSAIGDVADVLMTTHANIDARNSRPRPLAYPRVTGVAVDADIVGMDQMREFDRLLRLGPDVQKILRRIPESRVRGGENRRTPSPCDVRICHPLRIRRHFGLLHTTGRGRRNCHQ